MHYFSISYRLSAADIFQRASRKVIRSGFIWTMAILMTLYHLWTRFRQGEVQTLPAAILAGVILLGIIWLGILVLLPSLAILRHWPSIGHEIILTAEPDRLTVETEQGRQDVEWSAIRDIRAGARRIRVTLSTGPAIFLPKRAFSSPDQLGSFVAFCRNKIGAPLRRSS
jgi:hypothetical protein